MIESFVLCDLVVILYFLCFLDSFNMGSFNGVSYDDIPHNGDIIIPTDASDLS